MPARKSYNRFFIILQEDQKGYGLDSNKAPSGYAKLEVRNDKGKASFYVQNLKKQKGPYCMILIVQGKSGKELVNLGQVNIDNGGKADVSNEFDANNGSYLLKLNNDLTSIYSTFRMIEVKKVIGDVINEEQRISINKYVETLEGQYGGYFITEVSDGEDEIEAYNTKFNLESFYYAVSIKKFLNK